MRIGFVLEQGPGGVYDRFQIGVRKVCKNRLPVDTEKNGRGVADKD